MEPGNRQAIDTKPPAKCLQMKKDSDDCESNCSLNKRYIETAHFILH